MPSLPGSDRRLLMAIFVGGATGAGLRTALSQLVPTHPGQWPWATFTVNAVGCLLGGYFVAWLQGRPRVTAYRRPFLVTGLCGGLTTFSTFQLELLRMIDRGDHLLAVGYCAGSLAAGLGLVRLGSAAARRSRLT